jgi:hypothetical protein
MNECVRVNAQQTTTNLSDAGSRQRENMKPRESRAKPASGRADNFSLWVRLPPTRDHKLALASSELARQVEEVTAAVPVAPSGGSMVSGGMYTTLFEAPSGNQSRSNLDRR